jgi:hypothetical protein
MLARPKIGDIIEIPTRRGLAYAQYTHEIERLGALLRVLPGFFKARPPSFSDLVKEPASFVTFFPLRRALSRGILKVAGYEQVPDEAKRFPLFRAAGFVDRDGRVHDWRLWDGEREWAIGKLSAEQRALPIRGVWNDTLLIQRIEEGWTPATDPRSQS